MSIAKRWRIPAALLPALLAIAVPAPGAGAAPGPVSRAGGQASGVRHHLTPRDVAAGTSFGCKEDRVAAIPGYYATEKTCVEYGGGGIRAHSVTRCWRDGRISVSCKIINGDTVIAQLWWDDSPIAGTAAGDTDCGPCHENSHYSQPWCPSPGNYFFGLMGHVSQIRVMFPNGTLSGYHAHDSARLDDIGLTC